MSWLVVRAEGAIDALWDRLSLVNDSACALRRSLFMENDGCRHTGVTSVCAD